MSSSDTPDAVTSLPRHIALLWGRDDPTPRRGPKPALTVHDIAEAAVAVADARGWDAVSMKAIAESLGMTPMSLYRYVDSKDDVLDVMVDAALGTPDPAVLDPPDWRARLTAWAHVMAERLVRRPWLATIPLPRPPIGPNALGWTDLGVRCFEDTSLAGQQMMSALLLVDGFVRHHVRQASQMGLLPDGRADDGPSYESLLGALTAADTHPGIAAALASMPTDADDDFYTEQLDFGLTVILDGLAALVDG